MKEFRTLFVRWYFNQFASGDALYSTMCGVSEASPHHREGNVGIHTNMVVAEYLQRVTNTDWTQSDLYGAFACAFHDVGKPAARKEVYTPERGIYHRYGGHELISARLWEDWAVRNWELLSTTFEFDPVGIYRVGWLIENHLPWAIKKPDKRKILALGVSNTAGIDTFINVVKADTWGRISDDALEKYKAVNEWCDVFKDLHDDVVREHTNSFFDFDAPVLYLLVGTSGSGKSTLAKDEALYDIFSGGMMTFSMDTLRHEFYDMDDYSNAFKMSCEDSEFANKVNKRFSEMVTTGKDICSDNTNLGKKRRANLIRIARRSGYTVTAILLPVDLQTVLDRQSSRVDKSVPLEAVTRQYMSLSLPSLGEVDTIMIMGGNLP